MLDLTSFKQDTFPTEEQMLTDAFIQIPSVLNVRLVYYLPWNRFLKFIVVLDGFGMKPEVLVIGTTNGKSIAVIMLSHLLYYILT